MVSAFGCGFVLYFSKDLVALDTFDFWVGSVLIFMLALFQSLIYGWMFGIRRGELEAHRGAHIRIPRFVQWLLKFVVPVYLVTIFFFFCKENVLGEGGYAQKVLNDTVTGMSVLFIAVVFAFLLVMVNIAGRRWVAEGRFDDLDPADDDAQNEEAN